jgi:hypothetical protein
MSGFTNSAASSRQVVVQEMDKITSEKVYSELSPTELSRELAKSVLKEEERVNIDEMKKRAIHTARSYDEFRQMVLCANLKPLKSKELEALGQARPGQRSFTHNNIASNVAESTTGRFRRRIVNKPTPGTDAAPASVSSDIAATTTTPAAAISSADMSDPALTSITERARARARASPKPSGPGLSTKRRMPKNRSEFQRDWQRSCKSLDAQQSYFRDVGTKRFQKLFANGLPSGMLGSLLDTLHSMCSTENVTPEDTLIVVEMLKVLKSAPGFEMETMFLDAKERSRVQETLRAVAAEQDLLDSFQF